MIFYQYTLLSLAIAGLPYVECFGSHVVANGVRPLIESGPRHSQCLENDDPRAHRFNVYFSFKNYRGSPSKVYLGYFARSYRESDDLLSTLFMCPVATSGCPITSPPPHSTANAILDLLNLIPRSIQSALLIFLLLLLLLFIASLC